MRLIDADKFETNEDGFCDDCDLIDICDAVTCNFCANAEFKKLIEKQPTVDVFKWHNLRDNPNDLPKEDGYYLCIFEDDDTPYYTAFSENSFGDWHHDVHCELASHPIESYFTPFDDETVVIAWMRVLHFEGKMDEVNE